MRQKHSVMQLFLVALALVTGGYNLGRSFMGPHRGHDFAPLYVASRALLDGRQHLIYSTRADYQEFAEQLGVTHQPHSSQNTGLDLTNAYPPVVVVLLIPLALMPYNVARAAWYVLSLAAMAGALWVLVMNRPRTERRDLLIGGAVMTALLYPMYSSLYMGQVNSLLLFLMVAALHMARTNRQWAAGALVGVAGLIKIFPFVFVLWFLLTRRYRSVAAVVVTCVTMVAGSLLVVDWWVQSDFLFRMLPHQTLERGIERSQGLFGLFTRLLGTGDVVAPIAYMPSLAMALATVCAVCCILVTAVATWRDGQGNGFTSEISFALFLVVAILTSPKSWDHYAVYLLPAYLLFFDAITRPATPDTRTLTLVVAITYSIWISVMTTPAEVAQVPRSAIFQPLWSIKCLSMLALWVCLVRVMKLLKSEDGGLRI